MISVQEALRIIARELPDPVEERVPLCQAAGRRLSAPVTAGRDNPALHLAAMDGFAVAADSGRRSWSVEGVAAAGAARGVLTGKDRCLEIMTGAPMPQGADTVIPVEDVVRQNGTVTLSPDVGISKGRHIRRRGSNYRAHEALLRAGRELTAPGIAVLAAEGVSDVPVVRRLSVAILSTGSELVSPEESPEPHQIRASNLPALEAELRAAGLSVVAGEHGPDEYHQLREKIASLAARAEVLLMTGGVSRGKYDLVKPLLEDLGAEILFHWVAQKPGKPLLSASLPRPGGSCLLLGLPGNPQAALIAARRYLVEAAMEKHIARRPAFRIPLAEAVCSPAGKTLFQPVRLEQGSQGPEARPVETTGSGDYFGLSRADGFVELAAESEEVPAGAGVPFFGWSGGA